MEKVREKKGGTGKEGRGEKVECPISSILHSPLTQYETCPKKLTGKMAV